VSLGGVRVTQEANALKRRVGLVPQDLALYDELSAWANLQLFGGLYGLSAEQIIKRSGLQSRITTALIAKRFIYDQATNGRQHKSPWPSGPE
jgi:ABC-type multidrug transport system ATPase subunit